MSQPLTFPCPFCGRRMGVGVDLAGRHVRCPHCRQIVLAPALAPPQAAAVPPPPEVVFQPPPREGPDSILGDPDDSEDEVFSSSKDGNRFRIPQELANRDSPPAEDAAPENPFAFPPPAATSPPPPPPPVAPPVPPPPAAVADPNPFDDAHPTQLDLKPVAEAPRPPAPPNPWAALDAVPNHAPPPPPPPAVVVVPVPPDQPLAEEPARLTRRQPERAGGIPKPAFFALVGYAVLATGLAVYGLLIKSGGKVDPGHPLSTIPDDFGEFDPAQRKKKVSKFAFPIDRELPPELRVALGNTLSIGQLEVKPVKVAARPLNLIREGKSGNREPPERTKSDALVLTVRVKNTSPDVPVCPLDPAFNRKAISNQPHPATGLVVGTKTLWGGEIIWPFGERLGRQFEQDQADDPTPLKPGESREYVVFTAADGQATYYAKNAAGPLLWRVQVRRGTVEYRGKDVPVTAVVGVEFQKSDVPGL